MRDLNAADFWHRTYLTGRSTHQRFPGSVSSLAFDTCKAHCLHCMLHSSHLPGRVGIECGAAHALLSASDQDQCRLPMAWLQGTARAIANLSTLIAAPLGSLAQLLGHSSSLGWRRSGLCFRHAVDVARARSDTSVGACFLKIKNENNKKCLNCSS